MEIKNNQDKANEITRKNMKMSFEGDILQGKDLTARYCIMHDCGKMQYLAAGGGTADNYFFLAIGGVGMLLP